ncbi:MAG: hypothetical protein MUP15_07565 [Dehalococcoidia bacterium]|nr:hypothetical protein [Dehalococcoidia bacterium]
MTSAPSQLRRPMDVGQIIDTAIRLYRLNFGEFLAIAAITLPVSAASAIAGGLIEDKVVAAIVTAALAIPSIAIGLVAQAAIARAVADIDEGVAPDFNSVYGRVLPRVGTLFLTALRVAVIVLALCLTIVGIPFAIYFMVRWVFFTQTIIIDGETSGNATMASADIVQGSWWRTFGILIMVGILASLPAAAVSLLFSAASPVAANLASAVVAVVVFPFSAGTLTLLFFDLQSREREHVSIA